MSVNGDRTSVNDDGKLRSDGSDLGESNDAGGDLPREATTANWSSKVREFPSGRSRPRQCPWWSWSWSIGKWWVWVEEQDLGCGVAKTPAGLMTTEMGWAATFRASNGGIPVSFQWWRRWGCDRHLTSFRSVPSSADEVAGIGDWSRVKDTGRIWVNFSLSFSLACPSFLFWKPTPPFPFIETTFFFNDYY